MDFTRPVEAVIPGVQGRVLGVLARTDAELTIRSTARLAGVSVNRATTVVHDLVSLGIVQRREAGAAALVRLARDNEAARAVIALASLRERVLDRLRAEAQAIDPAPASMVVFGSFARGEAGPDSDIDVLVVRPAGGADDDWSDAVGTWADRARAIAGNPVNVIEADEDELPRLLRRKDSVWQQIGRDAILLAGRSPSALAPAGKR